MRSRTTSSVTPTRRRSTSGPDDVAGHVRGEGAWEIGIVDDVDLSDPELVGPPELDVWVRFAGAPDDPATDQALVAYSTDGFLIGTAMRPHAGVGQAQAHRTLSTGVLSHTLTYHERCPAAEWHLLEQRSSTYAGHGRSYGRGDIFRADGQLAASFVQDAMIRARSGGRRRALNGRGDRCGAASGRGAGELTGQPVVLAVHRPAARPPRPGTSR